MTDARSGPHHRPRAVGRRCCYGDVPSRVRDWVVARLGPVEVVREHIGGMSPGCATTLRTAAGDLVFVKAVGTTHGNPGSVELYRYELTVLAALPHAAHRPRLIDSYDDGTWVAVLLDHVEGRFADLRDERDFAAVAEVVTAQSVELTPPPEGFTPRAAADVAHKWLARWEEVAADPPRYLPDWATRRRDELLERVRRLPVRLDATTLCHFDVRDDNILVTPNGQVVLVDWGLACAGPSWLDAMSLALQLPDPDRSSAVLQASVAPTQLPVLVDTVVALAGSRAWTGEQPAPFGIPEMADFCRVDARHVFAVTERLVQR